MASTEVVVSKSAGDSSGSGEDLKSKVWRVVKSNPDVEKVGGSSSASTPVKLAPKQPDHSPPSHLAGQDTTSSTTTKDTTGVSTNESTAPGQV